MNDHHNPNIGHGQKLAKLDNGVVFNESGAGTFSTQNNGGRLPAARPEPVAVHPTTAIAGYGFTVYKDWMFAPAAGLSTFPPRRGSPTRTAPGPAGPTSPTGSCTTRPPTTAFTSAPGVYVPQFKSGFKILYFALDEASSHVEKSNAPAQQRKCISAPSSEPPCIPPNRMFEKTEPAPNVFSNDGSFLERFQRNKKVRNLWIKNQCLMVDECIEGGGR